MKTPMKAITLATLLALPASMLFSSCAGQDNRVDRRDGQQDHRDGRQDNRQDNRDDRQDHRKNRW